MFWNAQVSASVHIQTERVANTGTKKEVYPIQCRSTVLHTALWGNLSDVCLQTGDVRKCIMGLWMAVWVTGLIAAIGLRGENVRHTVRSGTHTGCVMRKSPTYWEAAEPAGKPPYVVLMFVTGLCVTWCWSADKIQNNARVEARGVYGGEERWIQGFGGKNLRERDRLENQDVDGRTLKWILKK